MVQNARDIGSVTEMDVEYEQIIKKFELQKECTGVINNESDEERTLWKFFESEVKIGTLRCELLDKTSLGVDEMEDLRRRIEGKLQEYFCHLACELDYIILMRTMEEITRDFGTLIELRKLHEQLMNKFELLQELLPPECKKK